MKDRVLSFEVKGGVNFWKVKTLQQLLILFEQSHGEGRRCGYGNNVESC